MDQALKMTTSEDQIQYVVLFDDNDSSNTQEKLEALIERNYALIRRT